jgi:hypothetical protein
VVERIEERRQKTEDRRQKTEDRRQKTEDRRQKTPRTPIPKRRLPPDDRFHEREGRKVA